MDITNRKALTDYQIYDQLEAGVSLTGAEVKSIREGRVSLDGAHIQLGVGRGTVEARLIGMHASSYLPAGVLHIDPARPRKLLLHKDQILSLWDKSRTKGFTLVPLKIYFRRGWAKVLVGLVRGKKKWEKKDTLKKRAQERTIERAMKREW